MPMLTPSLTIRADADRFRRIGRNPVSFILPGETRILTPGLGWLFYLRSHARIDLISGRFGLRLGRVCYPTNNVTV